MAIITTGILGRTSGKVASVVGGRWKGINYIREKVIPKNPNTPLQQAQRSNIRFAVAWAKPLIGVLLQPVLDRFVSRRSAYNDVVGRNVMQFEGVTDPNTIPADNANSFGNAFRISRGSLSNVPGLTIATATTGFPITWSPSAIGTLQPNDVVNYSISALDGSQPATVKQAPLSAGTVQFTTQELAPYSGKRCVVSVIVIRYGRPDTMEVPQAVSNSLTAIVSVS